MIDFELVKGKVVISPTTLTVSAFKDIWDSDSSKIKSKASNLLTYVFHICDITPKNPFRILPEAQRDAYAKRNAFGDQNYNIKGSEKEFIDRAIAWYDTLNKTSILRFTYAIDRKIDQITEYLMDPANDIKTMAEMEDQANLISKIDKLLISKKKADDFARDEGEKVKLRGNTTLSPLESGLLS